MPGTWRYSKYNQKTHSYLKPGKPLQKFDKKTKSPRKLKSKDTKVQRN